MLATLKEVMEPTYEGTYAVPAFNTWSFEDARAIINGAEEFKSPVILMTSGSAIKNWTVDIAASILRTLAQKSSVPVVLHLDHASDINIIYKAMCAGYTSIMYDGSTLPIEKNIANTKKVLEVAHALNISLEAEIGQIGRGEEGEAQKEILTEPEMAQKFLLEAPVDALAVAIGTCHGMQKQEANVQIELAKKISDMVSVPLVLHGSSGVKNKDLQYISSIGFGKINFGTKLKHSYVHQIQNILTNNPSIKDQVVLFTKAAGIVSEIVKEKISFVGSAGKA